MVWVYPKHIPCYLLPVITVYNAIACYCFTAQFAPKLHKYGVVILLSGHVNFIRAVFIL